jgi:hypothetical protein
MTQVAFPVGAVQPVLPYGEQFQLTNEYANQGFVFSDDDSDIPTGHKKYFQTPASHNVVRQGTLSEVYRINFSGNNVREATVIMRPAAGSLPLYKLAAFDANGTLLDLSQYNSGSSPTMAWYFHTVESSTPIKSIVFTQIANNQPTYGNLMTCLTFGTPAVPPVTPPATPPTTPPATCAAASVTANADAWFEQGSQSSNKGDDSSLKVQSKSGNDAKRSAVKFQLPAVPAGCVLDTANLRLYADSYSSGRTVQVQAFDGAWTESGITWANQPSVSGSVASAASPSDKEWITWSVTTQAEKWYTTGVNNGLLVRDAVETEDAEQSFNSREKGQNVPTLVLTFKPGTTVPTTPPVTPPTPPAPTPTPISCTSKTVTTNADAWFEQGSQSSNKGDDSSLKIQSKSGNDAFRATVGFALPTAPAGCVIDTATLRLYADSVTSGRTIAVQGISSTWSEMGVNWSKQPTGVGPTATAPSGSSKGWKTWNVTNIVGSSSFHGFVVRDSVENQSAEQVYNAREKGQNVPTLVVTYRPL